MPEHSKKKILLIYGSYIKLAFFDYLFKDEFKKNYRINMVNFDHHKSWYSNSYLRYIFNSLHILKIILHVLWFSPKSKIIIFGTNAARLFFPFLFWSNASVIFNELPELDPKNILYNYDRYIFSKYNKVYLSSAIRTDIVRKSYNLKRPIGILNNITELSASIIYDTNQVRDGIVYTGLINRSRFQKNDKKIKDLSRLSNQGIHLYGFKYNDFDLDETIFNYKGNLPYKELLETLKSYKFAILQYRQSDFNNDYCAPIKIYDYLAMGCIILSVNSNKGLKILESEFPGIIYFLDDIVAKNNIHSLEDLTFNKSSAQKCLSQAHLTNIEFSRDILGSIV
jgi:hypothetical protein